MNKHIIIIVLLGLGIYINSLRNAFVADDVQLIKENVYINDISNVKTFLSADYFKVTREGSYRPIASLTYFIGHHLFKDNPLGYRLINLSCHLFAAIIIYYLIISLFQNNQIALLTSLLFVAHPVHTEVLNTITFNEDIFGGMFYFASLLFFIRKKLFISLLSYFLALFTKEMAITLPLAIILYDVTVNPAKKNYVQKIKSYWGYAAITLFYLYVRFALLVNPSKSSFDFPSRSIETVLTMFNVFLYYIRLLTYPVGLCTPYCNFPTSKTLFEPMTIIAILIFIIVISISVIEYKRKKYVVPFFVFFFLISALPISNIIMPIGVYLAERYMYIPSLAFCGLISWGGYTLSERFHKWMGLSIIALFAVLVFSRNTVWKNDLTLWTDIADKFPGNWYAYDKLGDIYLKRGELDKSLEYTNRQINTLPEPERDIGYIRLAKIYSEKQMYTQAFAYLEQAIRANPHSVTAFYNRGVMQAKIGNIDAAIADYTKVIELQPDKIEALYNRGLMYSSKRSFVLALEDYETVITLDPQNAMAYNSIGNVYFNNISYKKAISNYSKAIEVKPNHGGAYFNRALTYSKENAYAEAIADSSRAIEINPQESRYYSFRGKIYEVLGKRDLAKSDFAKAASLAAYTR